MLEEVAGAGLEVRIPLKDIELGPRKRLIISTSVNAQDWHDESRVWA